MGRRTHIEPWLSEVELLEWLWIGQYNRQGPAGLQRKGRGGRRWAFLTLDQEQDLLATLQEQAGQGKVLTARGGGLMRI